jgi:menaquinone-dependent protoporphyrinogen oxidase
MSKRVLVAYGSKSGSTAEVADAIGRALAGAGVVVEVRRAGAVRSTAGYDAVVLGGPRVSSLWHPDASDFLARLHAELAGKPVAYFITSMTLTRSVDERVGSIPIIQDPAHARPAEVEGKLGFMEKQSTHAAYLKPVLQQAPDVVPVQVAFLAGKLDYATLDFLSRALFKVILRMKPADLRNWALIRSWARGLPEVLLGAAAPCGQARREAAA